MEVHLLVAEQPVNISAQAASYASTMEEYAEKKADSDAQKAAYAAEIDRIRARIDGLVAQVRAFAEQQRKHLSELRLTPNSRKAAPVMIDDEFAEF